MRKSRQKSKKWGCWKNSKPKNEKNGSSGNSDAAFFHNEKCWRRPKSRTFVGN